MIYRLARKTTLNQRASKENYRSLLTELFWAIEGIQNFGQVGSGTHPSPGVESEDEEVRLLEFIYRFTLGGHSPHDLDISIPVDIPKNGISLEAQIEAFEVSSALCPNNDKEPIYEAGDMDVDMGEDLDKVAKVEASGTGEEVTGTRVPPKVADAPRGRPSDREDGAPSPEHKPPEEVKKLSPSAQVAAHLSSPPLAETTPGLVRRNNNLNHSSAITYSNPDGLKPHSPHHSSKSPTENPLPSRAIKPSTDRVKLLISDGVVKSSRTSLYVSPDYAQTLPPLPVHVINSRLLAAQAVVGVPSKPARRQGARSGLWVGSGGSEITKLGIRAQYSGVKSVLRKVDYHRNPNQPEVPRLNNILTSADWKMTRAIEIVERLKASRAWSYSQLKKPRTPSVPKAHWDHLLDEMVDFRQERRWKIATAFRLARQIVAWHASDSIGRKKLQITTSSKAIKKIPSNPDLVASKLEAHFEPELQSITSPDPQDKSISRISLELHTSNPSRPILSTDSTPGAEVDKSSVNTERNQSVPQDARRIFQQIKRYRIPIYETDPYETMIDPATLSLEGLCPPSNNYIMEHCKLNKLFGDLPLFGDLDTRSEKRADESSLYHGRITRVAPHLDSKPLLVSTLQPSRNYSRVQWRNLEPLAVEDYRDTSEPRADTGHHLSHLFAGRKTKEQKESNLDGKPLPPRSSCTLNRIEHLKWEPQEEELLGQICHAYGFNWKLVADILNSNSSRSMSDRLTPRDCYDCWMRLYPPSGETSVPGSQSVPLKSTDSHNSATPLAIASTSDSAELANNNLMNDDSVKRTTEEVTLFPNKRSARETALQCVSQRVKEKRAAAAPKLLPTDQPLQINLNSHETHTQPLRPYMSPLEMSALKAERDRQTQAALEMAKRQQQVQHESLLHQARVAAAAQIPIRATSVNISGPSSSNSPSRAVSQSVLPKVSQARNGAIPAVTIHRQTTTNHSRYPSRTPASHSSHNRVVSSPGPANSQEASPPENLSAVTSSTGAQPPILPQIPAIPQGFQNINSSPQSSPGPSAMNQTPRSGSPRNSSTLPNATLSHGLTQAQVTQYLHQHLQAQQHQHHAAEQHQAHLLQQHQAQPLQQLQQRQPQATPFTQQKPSVPPDRS
ncbi:hypothetical protein PPACK8108_LOCUS14316 [Phakopsora pachyrhizi]|uniref:Vacuolar import and degradation protein 21 n=1 Tax=Phakopsora pachyrhizi TaxID=170000 RepID=A0AAV0B610_PHAPC|nr:hypothetical protein PPACK8108_LOCUS14316 [Phakopsora pachyrhizi]